MHAQLLPKLLHEIPPSVLGIEALGIVQSLYLIVAKPWTKDPRGAWATPAASITESSIAFPRVLLAYRVLALVWSLSVALYQLSQKGLYIFKFYTVWNYYLLIAFFATASLASYTAARRKRLSVKELKKGDADAVADADADADGHSNGSEEVNTLGYIVMVLFHINLTTVFIVDVLTWTVLWPMLKQNPDPTKVARFQQELFNWVSYNQHGANAFLMVGETLLNAMPVHLYLMGYVGLWSCAYGVWAFVHHLVTGRWMYPFLDAQKPWAPLAYAGLFLVHWLFFGMVVILRRIKLMVLDILSRAGVDKQQAAKAHAKMN